MTEKFENHTIRLLQELRESSAQQAGEIRAQIAVLAQGQVGIRTEVQALRSEVREVQSDVQRVNLHLQEVAIILDHHSTRLDAIERQLGLDKSKH